MQIKKRFLALAIFVLSGTPHLARAQEMPGMQHDSSGQSMTHDHMMETAPKVMLPRFGRAQEKPGETLFTLEQARKLAEESNPTLRQAEAGIRAAKARAEQAGIYPNPSIGYTGDEIRGGSTGGGKQGFFVQQTMVTGGKLARGRDVFFKESELAELESQEQKLRVENSVKTAFYRVLAAQELLDARGELAQIEMNYAETQKRLFNTGQADESELLEAEIESQRQRLAARMQENTLREEWRSLAAVMGRPDLPLATVAGNLEQGWPELDEDQVVEEIASKSPAVGIAGAASQRALAEIAQAKSMVIPDINIRAGMEYNNEPPAMAPYAKGWEGLAEVSIPIPFFNRNQGNISAANADLDRAKLEQQRIALTLRDRAATVVDQYSSAKLSAMEYRDELLPRARKAYTLLMKKYGQMLASPPRVLEAQRRMFQLQTEYIASLDAVWTTGIALQGYLLTDGLEAPARPGEMDRPVRETNVPLPERMYSPSAVPMRP